MNQSINHAHVKKRTEVRTDSYVSTRGRFFGLDDAYVNTRGRLGLEEEMMGEDVRFPRAVGDGGPSEEARFWADMTGGGSTGSGDGGLSEDARFARIAGG